MDNQGCFGTVTRALHWSMAVLIGWQFVGMISKVAVGREHPVSQFLGGYHLNIGTVLFVLIVLRLACLHQPPQPALARGGAFGQGGCCGPYRDLYADAPRAADGADPRLGTRARLFSFGFELFAPARPIPW
ncbi:cytochrome b [Paracoccus cavernae]|uniref:cytochrome b n=1 Tax=Paracoccus cavernae TaxID=1571207 RepID=UPI00361911EC